MPFHAHQTRSPASDDEYRPNNGNNQEIEDEQVFEGDTIVVALNPPRKKRNFRDSELNSFTAHNEPTLENYQKQLTELEQRLVHLAERNRQGYIKNDEMEVFVEAAILNIRSLTSFTENLAHNPNFSSMSEATLTSKSEDHICFKHYRKKISRLETKVSTLKQNLNQQSQQIRSKDKVMHDLQVENEELKQQIATNNVNHTTTSFCGSIASNNKDDNGHEQLVSISMSSVNAKFIQHDRELHSIWKEILDLRRQAALSKGINYVGLNTPPLDHEVV